MCLGVPGRIVAIDGVVATVDYWGVRRETRLDIVDEPVAIGDYVLNHVGYAIRRIPEAEIAETIALYEQLLGGAPGSSEGDAPPDLMAAELLGEIRGAPTAAPGGPTADDA